MIDVDYVMCSRPVGIGARRGQPREVAERVACEQRTSGTVPDTRQQGLGRRAEPHHGAPFAHRCPVVLAQHCAATGGNDERLVTPQQVDQHVVLAVAEPGLTLGGEDLGDLAAERALDRRVEIDMAAV
ncbi:unannotated protein [freshwater metagenome]|uniref:Unannotated protein n=1 Tax=freshwater metagenome TaxID=449393 RepID=A0A6J6TFC4_9ZZZZ